MAARQNLTVNQGEDYQQALILKDEAQELMDLTGYTFRGMAKLRYEDANPAFSLDFTLRDQATDPGVVDMRIAASSTSAVSIQKATKYKYDIEMVDADEIVRRIIEGEIQLNPEVTK